MGPFKLLLLGDKNVYQKLNAFVVINDAFYSRNEWKSWMNGFFAFPK